MTNAEHRRQMTGNMPTGEYKLADQRFTVRRIEPKPVEEEPSTVPSILDLDGYDGAYCYPLTPYTLRLMQERS